MTEFFRGVESGLGMGTSGDVVLLNRDLFDAIEFDAAFSGDHRAAAEQMINLAASGTQTEEFSRSEAYLRAGEQWLLADEPAAAAHGFRRALEDGGPAFVDPRVPLARALFLMDKPAEADALIQQIEREQPSDPRIYDLVAELLMERSDLTGALRWATTGVGLCLGRLGAGWDAGAPAAADRPAMSTANGDPTELRLLLTLRYRIRNDLGLPEDDYDRLLDELPSGPATPAGDS
ncbi:MAG: tetratricopeptide repeat protein [Streptosporangiaceae bacterium]